MTTKREKPEPASPPILNDAPDEVIAAFRALTPKLRRFALALPLAPTQVEAAVQAGYQKITAKKNAATMAQNPNVRLVVDWCCNRAIQNTALDVERLKRELAMLCYSDPADLFDEKGNLLNLRDVPEHSRRAVSGMEFGKTVKFTMWDKKSAIDSALKLLDAFPRKDKNPLGPMGVVGYVVVPERGHYQHPERQAIDLDKNDVKRVEPPQPAGKTFRVTKQD